MTPDNDLLFGLIAVQTGAVAPERLSEILSEWSKDRSVTLADRMVNRGCLTVEQKNLVDGLVAQELESHDGDPEVTLATAMDGRFLDAVRDVSPAIGKELASLAERYGIRANYELLGSTRPADENSSGRYTRTRLHAKGGMGQVWVARDQSLGRQIALKELRPDQKHNSVLLSRFLYEAKITAQLEHPGIVPVYELGGGPLPFYTMRFVKGRTLSEAIRAYHQSRKARDIDPLGLANLLNAFVGVCHAIAYAHSRGVIHRDLKGQNIVLGDFGEVIVLDWGIAKEVSAQAGGPPVANANRAELSNQETFFIRNDPQDGDATEMATVDSYDPSPSGVGGSSARSDPLPFYSGAGSEATIQGELLGTPGFMAPEQASGWLDQIDQRTDVYGLGAVLYEILTGVPPFEGKKTIEIVQRVRLEPPKAPRERNPSVDLPLEAICLKAISKRKEQRYASATELAQEVQRYLADQPVAAFPEPWSMRALRWGRRHRVSVATGLGLLFTTTIALAVGTVLVSRERNEAKFQGKEARQAVDDMYTKVAENWLEDRLDPLQKEFLGKTLAHYQTLTAEAADSPEVKLEHGRAFQRMGDINRKLGDLEQASENYHRALQLLEPLHASRPDDHDVTRALALTQTHLGDLMLRRGQNDQAKSLYQQALTLEQTAATAANSTDDDRWLMARTMRSQAGLLRLMGDFTGSHAVYGQAIAMLEKTAPASAPSDVRNELALARNALGQLLLDMDDQKQAESEFRGALAVLEPLVTEFPTAPRFRESLATASNSIGLIEERDGRVADCEVQYRRELAEEERLAQDFPDRPEYKRELARASMNLGNLLEAEGRMAEAQALLRRSISLNTELISKQPDDVQVRLDLSKGHTNLGESYRDSGHPERSIAEYEKSRDLASVLIEQFPDSPRYREQLAGNLQNLALAYDAKGDATAEPTYAESLKMYEALVRKFPDNAQYKEGLARSLRNFGAYEAATNRLDRAESCYIRGLSVLKNLHTTESQRIQVGNYVNLGNLRNDAHRPGAEEPLRQAVAISEVLVARKPATREDRVSLAIAQNDLGETMRNSDRTEEAGRLYESAIAGFNTLASENPKAIDIQDYLGYTYESQAELLEKIGQPNKARQSIEAAVQHQQNAIKLSDGKVVGYRVALAGHLGILTKLCIELHAYDDALRAAVEMSKVPPPSSHAYLDPAKLLAHGMTAATQDAHLTSAQREQVIQQYSGEIAMLLRQAMDASPKSRERIKSDPDLSPMLARPEFQSLLGTFATPAAAKAH